MIRINLLQIKRKKKAKPLPSFVILTVLFIMAGLLSSFFFYFNLKNKVNILASQKRTNQIRIEELKKVVGEVIDFEAKIKKFQERKNVIETLRKNQSLPVKILNELGNDLAEGVWLNEFSVKAANVDTKGYGFANSNVVEFVNNLKRSKMFTDVYLEETKETKIDKVNLYEFKLKFTIRAD